MLSTQVRVLARSGFETGLIERWSRIGVDGLLALVCWELRASDRRRVLARFTITRLGGSADARDGVGGDMLRAYEPA